MTWLFTPYFPLPGMPSFISSHSYLVLIIWHQFKMLLPFVTLHKQPVWSLHPSYLSVLYTYMYNIYNSCTCVHVWKYSAIYTQATIVLIYIYYYTDIILDTVCFKQHLVIVSICTSPNVSYDPQSYHWLSQFFLYPISLVSSLHTDVTQTKQNSCENNLWHFSPF